jgi:hypothetical protein
MAPPNPFAASRNVMLSIEAIGSPVSGGEQSIYLTNKILEMEGF